MAYGGTSSSAAMRFDPNTHAFVMATALMTSISFAIFGTTAVVLALVWLFG